MGLAKQAKVLSKRQIALTAALVAQTRYPTRNHAIFLLSVKAGLRAKEIAELTWDMVTDAEGNLGTSLHLRDEASKGASGRVIPLNKELRAALQKLHDATPHVALRHHHRAIGAHVSKCHREPVCSLVPGSWFAGLFKSFWPAHVHHERRPHNLDGRRLAARRADAGWP